MCAFPYLVAGAVGLQMALAIKGQLPRVSVWPLGCLCALSHTPFQGVNLGGAAQVGVLGFASRPLGGLQGFDDSQLGVIFRSPRCGCKAFYPYRFLRRPTVRCLCRHYPACCEEQKQSFTHVFPVIVASFCASSILPAPGLHTLCSVSFWRILRGP